MNRPLSRLATRAARGASQLPRIAWYLSHGPAMTRIAQRARDGGSARPRSHTDAPIPDRKRFFADMVALWQQDLANVEADVYPLPAMKMLLDRSRLFFEDLPAIHRRRESGDQSEVLTEETRGKRPRYYLQNFQFQSGGWMTDESGQRNDTQVEVLFSGGANAKRRQDAVTSIFMFHELPPKVRRIILSEFARMLKPGGRLVLVDSLQHGDEPDYDARIPRPDRPRGSGRARRVLLVGTNLFESVDAKR